MRGVRRMRILKRDRVVRSGAPRLKNRQRETLSGLLFFLPWVIGFLAITCYPLIYSIVISFNQVAIRPGEVVLEPVGWEYFRQALFLDTEFPTLLVASVTQVAIGTPISVVFALVMALLLNRGFKGRTVYRMLIQEATSMAWQFRTFRRIPSRFTPHLHQNQPHGALTTSPRSGRYCRSDLGLFCVALYHIFCILPFKSKIFR